MEFSCMATSNFFIFSYFGQIKIDNIEYVREKRIDSN